MPPRERVEGKLRVQAQTHQTRLALIDKLGLRFEWQNYGVGGGLPFQGGYHNPYLNLNGVSGSTLYQTYQQQTNTSGYNALDAMVGIQQASALIKNGQDGGHASMAQLLEIVRQVGADQKNLAEIDAKSRNVIAVAQAMQIIAQSIRPEPRTETKTTVTTPVQPQVLPQAAPGNGAEKAANRKIFFAGCIACHDKQEKWSGIDLRKWDGLPLEQRLEVISRLTTKNQDRQMPRTEDGKPGPRVNMAGLSLLTD